MTQYNWGTTDPTTTSGDALAAKLDNWVAATQSSHGGATEPSYKTAGIKWLDTTATPWILKIYDGADWIPLFAIDATANKSWPVFSGKQLSFDLAGGSANALTLTPTVPVTAYADLDFQSFEAAANNTAAATLNVSGVGAKAIRKMSSGADVALAANDILDGVRYMVTYDVAANSAAGAWILINPSSANATLTGTETLSNKTLVQPKIQDLSTSFAYTIVPSTLAANRNITLPVLAANDTFVFKANDILPGATWNAGVGTIESLITPAKLAGAISTLAPAPQKSATTSFTASGTWNKPSWATSDSIVIIEGWGAGAGGGTGGRAGGGGGGAYNRQVYRASQLGSSETVTIAGAPAAATNGGNSTVGTKFTAYGGAKGVNGASGAGFGGGGGGGMSSAGSNTQGGNNQGGVGDPFNGGGSGGNGSSTGGRGGGGGGVAGQTATSASTSTGGPGADSFWGGGGGGGGGNGGAAGGNGGNSIFGGAGGGGEQSGSSGGTSTFGGAGGAYNVAGTAPGGGGGGNAGGSRGEIRITVIP